MYASLCFCGIMNQHKKIAIILKAPSSYHHKLSGPRCVRNGIHGFKKYIGCTLKKLDLLEPSLEKYGATWNNATPIPGIAYNIQCFKNELR